MLYISLLTLPASEHLCRDILARLASDNLPKSGLVIFLSLVGLLTCSQKLTVFVDFAGQTSGDIARAPVAPYIRSEREIEVEAHRQVSE